jgi:DNA polymerase III subunit epsilon
VVAGTNDSRLIRLPGLSTVPATSTPSGIRLKLPRGEISAISRPLPAPSVSAYNAGVQTYDLKSLKGNRADSVEWANRLLESGGFCVLDSETTGLQPPVAFAEVAVVDADAKALFKGTIRPGCRIEAGATRIHGHTARSLAGSPPFLEVYPDLLEALWGGTVIVYNASYDRRVWDAAVRSLGARGALAGELPPWKCAMRRYAAYVGEPSKRGGYRSQKLPGGDHSALGDALATLRLVQQMAAGG